MPSKEQVYAALRELVGVCGHCGRRTCIARRDRSVLPERIKLTDLDKAFKMAEEARDGK